MKWPFKFGIDANNKSGAILGWRAGTNFAIPQLDGTATAIPLTRTALAANGSFTGTVYDRFALTTGATADTGEDLTTLPGVFVTKYRGVVFTDQAGTLYIEESNDNATWTQTATVTVTAGQPADSGWVYLSKRYYRARYVNGASAQTYFSLLDSAGAGLEDVVSTPTVYNPMTAKSETVYGRGNAATVVKGRWYQIGAGATTTQIPLLTTSGLSMVLSASSQAQLVGSRVDIYEGNTLYQTVVSAVSSSGTLTVEALPAAPTAGTQILLVPPEQSALSGSNTQNVTFQSAVGASGNGSAVSVKGWKTLVVEIFGASTPAGTVNFQAASISGTFAPITGTNLNALAQATSTTGISTTPTQWQFDIEGLDEFQCPVTWTSGTITVQGRLQA